MDELLERAVKTAEAQKISNEPFELSNLFSRKEWNSFDKKVRIDLGQSFSFAVEKKRVKGVRFDGEGQTHHNLYIKYE